MKRKFKLEKLSLYSILDVYKKLNTDSILEKLYIYQLENNKTNEIAFLQEAGEVFIIAKNWKMAAVAFQRIIDSNQSDTMDNYFLGLSYLNLNKFVQAKFYFQNVIDSYPDFADVYYRFGLIAEKNKDWQEAKKYYKKAINILPNHIECLKSLHYIYEKRN
jgi:tetratricopeptide (TPR) repeat protein